LILTQEESELVIIGTGPSAVAAAQAAIDNNRKVIILDQAKTLPENFQKAEHRFKTLVRDNSHIIELGRLAKSRPAKAALKKRHYSGLELPVDENLEYTLEPPPNGPGGLSQFWGANIFPFLPQDFADWPINLQTLEPYYQKILSIIPCCYDKDHIKPFQLEPRISSTKIYSDAARGILSKLDGNAPALKKLGFSFGGTPLSLWETNSLGEHCLLCKMCLSGCPFDLIYSTRHWFHKNIANSLVELQLDSEVESLREERDYLTLKVKNSSGEFRELKTKNVLIGAGPIGTAKILTKSFPDLLTSPILIRDSGYFFNPVVILNAEGLADQTASQSLSQIFIRLDDNHSNSKAVHSLLYSFSPIYHQLLPSTLNAVPKLKSMLLAKIGAIQGYLHSEDSGHLELQRNALGETKLLRFDNKESRMKANSFLSLIRKNSFKLGLFPIPGLLNIPVPGSGFHFGSSFPMSISSSFGKTDLFGKLNQTSGVHIIDSSVFPTMPATNPTLTIMANAYRIAERVFQR
jgi:choline dehydrogenase-like flavoprotein